MVLLVPVDEFGDAGADGGGGLVAELGFDAVDVGVKVIVDEVSKTRNQRGKNERGNNRGKGPAAREEIRRVHTHRRGDHVVRTRDFNSG